KKRPRPGDCISCEFSIIGGSGLHDAKNFTRYIQSAGEKMKGAALATENLHALDDAIKPHSVADTRSGIVSDFSIITAEDGTYELMETALCQRYTVYVHNRPDTMMMSVADAVIIEEPIPFLEEFVKNLRKITFKPKKISKK
ncbi:MAG: hypothetical protein ACOCWH_06975, partial [Spirochaetota bacterium]